jgi:hypothetical protein
VAFAEPELIPEEVSALRALPQLLWLAALFFALGCCVLVDGFTRALFGTVSGVVGWIPYLGSVLEAPIHSIEQKITSALGAAEAGIDAQMGHAFHQLASIVVGIGRGFAAFGVALWQLGERLGHGAADVASAAQLATQAQTAAVTAAESAAAVGHHAAVAEAELGRGIDDLGTRARELAHELGDVVAPELAGARARIDGLERELGHAWDLLREHDKALGLAGITAAVGLAAAELGMSWTRCANNNALGRAYCGLPRSLVDDLVAALTLVAAGTFTLEQLARYLQTIIVDGEHAIADFWRVTAPAVVHNPALGTSGV